MEDSRHHLWQRRSLAAALVIALAGTGLTQAFATPESTRTISRTTQQAEQTTPSFTNARVSYLGPEGTYTQEAARHVFGEDSKLVSEKTVADAADALDKGEVNYCVIPQENTIGGPVTDYLDIVVDHKDISIACEIELPISQNLLVRPGTKLEHITCVYSHKQGIAQGGAWIQEHIPAAEVIETTSTAEGARIVAEEGDGTTAAICSAGCAEVYGLEIFARDIQQSDANKTRFYVLSRDTPRKGAGERMALLAEGPARALPRLMAAIDDLGLTLVCCHDRPAKTALGTYRYLIEVAGVKDTSFEAISAIPGFTYRYLGVFSLA